MRMAIATAAAACLLVTACDGARQEVAQEPAGESPTPAVPAAEPEVHQDRRVPEPEPAGTEDWRMDRPAEGGSWPTRRSQRPAGTAVGLKVSTSAGRATGCGPTGSAATGAEAAPRCGSRRRSAAAAAGPGLPARRDPHRGRAVAPDLTIDTTGWEPGFYVLKLRTGIGWHTQVPYVVSSPSAAGTVALVAPVTTWQAYNPGAATASTTARPATAAAGRSASTVRTTGRPAPTTTAPPRCRSWSGPRSSASRCRYYTNVDLDQRPALLAGARGYVSLGHDEYWTPAMRDAVTRARDAGTNLAFLGANTMYWRIRLEDRDTGPARWWWATGTTRTSTRCATSGPPRRPHGSATRRRRGPSTSWSGCSTSATRSTPTTSSPRPAGGASRGTGVRLGDRVPGLVGPEADRVYPDGDSPRPLQVLSHTPYDCRGVRPLDPVRLLHDPVGRRRLHGRDAAVGLRADRPLRTAAGRPDEPVRPDRDRQRPARLRSGPGRCAPPGA